MTPRSPNGARLSPGRVRSMSFRLARLGHRGLDEDDVRDFCDQVEEELSQLLQERNALQREVHQLRSWARTRNQAGSHARNRAGTGPALPLSAPPAAGTAGSWASGAAGAVEARAAGPAEARAAGIAGVPALTARVGGHSLTPPHGTALVPPRCRHQDAHGQAVRVLAKAQQTADQYVSDAHAYSRTVAHDAQRRREKILAEAHAQATVMLEHAHQAAVRAGLTPGRGPARPAAAVPVLPAPVPEPREPAPHRAPDHSSSAEPAIYNAVVARYPHVAPVRRELRASPGPTDSHRADRSRPGDHPDQARYPAPAADSQRYPEPTGYPDPTGHSSPAAGYRTSAYNPPAPPPDYSTVIDYPGPAADYQALRPVHHESRRDRDRRDRDRPSRDRSGRNNDWFNRDSSRHPDRYRDHDPGQSPFPF